MTPHAVKSVLCWVFLLLLGGCSDATWTRELASEVTAGPLILQERLLLATSSAGVVRQLRALDPDTGVEHYRVEVGGWSDCPLLLGEPERLILGCGALLQAYEPATGLRIWQEDLPGQLMPPWTLADGALSFSVQTEKEGRQALVADARTGQMRVRTSLTPDAELLRLKEELLIWEAGTLRSLSLTDGYERWRTPLTASLVKLIKGPRELYAVSEEGLTALEPETGLRRWFQPTTGLVTPVATEGLVVYAQAGQLFGLDASDGKVRWQHGLAGVIQSPILRPDALLVHTAGGTLLLLSPADGEPVWQLGIGPPGRSFQATDAYYLWRAEETLAVVSLPSRREQLRLPLLEPSRRPARPGRSEPAVLLEGNRLYVAQPGGTLSMRVLER